MFAPCIYNIKNTLLFQLMHTIINQRYGGIPLVCRHNIDHIINDEHNRIIIVVLAKYEIAP